MDCSHTTVKELRKLCKKHGVKGCYKLRKKQLCKNLEPYLELPPPLTAQLPPVAQKPDFFSRKCEGRKFPGKTTVWAKTDLVKMCKKHKIDDCSSRMTKHQLCKRLASYFRDLEEKKKPSIPKDVEGQFRAKSCKGRKSAKSWGKDELLEFCEKVGLDCNKRSTKAKICKQLTQYFEGLAKAVKILSLGAVQPQPKHPNKRKSISQEVDHVMIFMAGLIWLIRKYRKSVCIPIRLASLRSPRFGVSFCHFCICWYAKDERFVWGFTEHEDMFWDTLSSWCEGAKPFAIMPLYIIGTDNKRHMNFLLFDLKKRTMERFEPNGSITAEDAIGKLNKEAVLERRLAASAKAHNYTYIATMEFCPRLGPQALQDAQALFTEIGDTEGFCSFWSLWYADRRLRYPDMAPQDLLQGLMNVLSDEKNLTKFIRNFAEFIENEKERITEKAKEYRQQSDWSVKRAVTEALLWELLRG